MTILIALAIVLVVDVSVPKWQVRQQFGGEAQKVLSEQAKRVTISTVVSGSGMLLNVNTETISVPSCVKRYAVKWIC